MEKFATSKPVTCSLMNIYAEADRLGYELNEEEALKIIQLIESNQDKSICINWEIISENIQDYVDFQILINNK
jgi:hypothetical protein